MKRRADRAPVGAQRGSGRRSCPCCGAALTEPPAFVHDVPVLLNVLAATEAEARRAPTARLELVECPTCGVVFNQAFEGVPYGPDYFLDPTRSERYRRHLDDVSDRLATHLTGRPTFTVVDVGAGQGTFLSHLVRRLPTRVTRAHGFDPAFRAAEASLPAGVEITAAPLDARTAAVLDFTVDVVVTRHVVEHVADPAAFLASFRASFSPPFTLVVETPNVGHTLERGLLHDFCYEHCTMLSEEALAEVLRRAGYERVGVERAFGGEYLLAFATAPATTRTVDAPVQAAATRRTAPRLAAVAARFVPEHRARLQRARARGAVAIWGGAGKGALFAHLVDPDRELVTVVVDIHPSKQGMFLPGAGHEVVSPEEARRRGVRTVVVANASYADEVATLCTTLGIRGELECVGDPPFARRIGG